MTDPFQYPLGFDPFSALNFSWSQAERLKYGPAMVLMEPPEAFVDLAPFTPFDIRYTTPREMTAWWIRFALRLRKEGSRLFVPLLAALRDPVSREIVRLALSQPPSLKRLRDRLRPARRALETEEATRLAYIRQGVVAVFLGKDPLAGLDADCQVRARSRGEALWRAETDLPPGQRPGEGYRVPAGVEREEVGAILHFLARLYRDEGAIGIEGYIPDVRYAPRVDQAIADPYLNFALRVGLCTWRPAADLRARLRRRETMLKRALADRLDALAAFGYQLGQPNNSPHDLLDLLNSHWPADAYSDYAEIDHEPETGA